jgi:hypothetical protein
MPVVTAGADQRHLRAGGEQERRLAGRAPVVGHGQQLDGQLGAGSQQRRLCLPLRVAGEQRPPSLVGHPQHGRGLVELAPRVTVGPSGGRAEHVDPQVAEHDPVPCRHVADGDRAGGRLLEQRGGLGQLGRYRPVPDRGDVEPPQHLRGTAHVVEVSVGHHEQVERRAPLLPQPPRRGRVLTGVDEYPRGRGLEQVGVTLTDVDRRDREPRGRQPPADLRHPRRGDQRDARDERHPG